MAAEMRKQDLIDMVSLGDYVETLHGRGHVIGKAGYAVHVTFPEPNKESQWAYVHEIRILSALDRLAELG